MASLIECEDLCFGQREGECLDNIHLEVKEGQKLAIFPSPYGPAANLIKIFATLEEPNRGGLRLFGEKVDFSDEIQLLQLRRKIAMVHGESVLISNLTVIENVTLGVCYHENRKLREVEGEVMDLLRRLNLEKDCLERPSTVDHYKRRRAIYAMELMKRPRVVLLDQPLRDFPQYDRHYFREILSVLDSDPSRGMVITTQNKGFIKQWADSVMVLNDGRVEALCDPMEMEQAIG